MTSFTFAPATREQAKARIALQGPAGSGKTKSALLMAETLAAGGPIGLIDTERRSAAKYAPVPGRPDLGGHQFLHLPMDSYDPRDLAKAVHAAADAGIACLIVDSWSHFYAGKGGLLELVDGFGRKAGAAGTFGGWKEATPIEQETLDTLLRFPGHLIVTLRTKNDYSLEGGKVTHHGVKVIQREGTEYEFDVIATMVEGTATFTKTRCPALTGAVYRHPGEDVANVILEWLGEGVDPVQVILDDLLAEGLTYQAAIDLHNRAKGRNLLDAAVQHPVSRASMTLGALIAEYGQAAKPKAAPTRPQQPTDHEVALAASSQYHAVRVDAHSVTDERLAAERPTAAPTDPRARALDELRGAAVAADVAATLETDFAQSYGVALTGATVEQIREMAALLRGAA
ncbi:hypothetical protein ABH930_000272 [Kitasatospora sp. GAS204A]|uniref:AAA family ATPase n=1 Tax=unclassified Kitasatospora TaxID=2633591 RepID=UPI0024741237|nr:AAA family ATPase [Kitasatospora sp. GAS204B]MDH6116853.1 hypothetical protein [Kitasatospora sp. GAS204B]